MKNKYILLFIVGLLIHFVSVAQENTSTKITVFKPEDSGPTNAAAAKPTEYVNCIKWNYTALSRGVFLMNYEYILQKKLSAEVGLGLTFRDFLFEAFHGSYFSDLNSTAKFGFAIEGGIRFYPKEVNEFEGFFVSPIVSYRSYSVPQTTEPTSNNQPLTTFEAGYNFTDVQFKIGYSYESLWDVDLLGELYAGVAMRYATVNYYDLNYVNGAAEYTATKAKLQLPQLLLGFKFGLPF
jgi:hypothetical protein